MSAVQLSSLSHRFDRQILLDDLSLNAREGEYLVILGESGSGKSTLLQVIAGLQVPDSGKIEIGGRDMGGVAPHLRGVSFLFQHDSLYPHLSVRQNVQFGSRKIRDAGGHWSEVLRLTRIDDLLDRSPETLSGGEKKRVGLAKSLFRKASVQLLDEPLSAIDAAHRSALTMDLREIHQACDSTVIHVTHDAEEAFRLADRIAVLHDGRIRQIDSPRTLASAPAHLAVTRLLGVFGANEFVVRQGDQTADAMALGSIDQCKAASPRVVIPSSAIRLTAAKEAERSSASDVTLFRRADQCWHSEGLVSCVRHFPLGDEIELTTIGLTWLVRTAGRVDVSAGPVCIEVDARSVHWFDESGCVIDTKTLPGS